MRPDQMPKTFSLMTEIRVLSFMQAKLESLSNEDDDEQKESEIIKLMMEIAKADGAIKQEIARLYGEAEKS